MGIIRKFARLIGSWNELGVISHKLDAVVAGIDNHARLTNDKSAALIAAAEHQSVLLDQKLNQLVEGFDNLAQSINSLLGGLLSATGTHLTATEAMSARLAELQQAQLILQREMADALDEFIATAKAPGRKPGGDWNEACAVAGPRPATELAR
jgi:hypothetical protein